MYHKGYIKTKNKISVEKIKDREDFSDFDSIRHLNEYAGVIADGIVLVDVDDLTQSDILFNILKDKSIQCKIYETSRGKHFLFSSSMQTNLVKCTSAIGIPMDIKLGIKNSYQVLKHRGIERKVLYDSETPDDMPKWLHPIDIKAEFFEMKEGDGRNQELFNYILTLQSNGFSVEETKECIRIINRYILKQPLNTKELETIIRDGAFPSDIFIKNKAFLFDKFSLYLKSRLNVIKIYNQLHYYSNGVYVSGKKRFESEMINIMPTLNRARRFEVYDYLDAIVQNEGHKDNVNLIPFKNGVYDINSEKLLDFAPNHILTNRIDWNYNEKANCELIDKTLDRISCNDKQIRMLLEEMIGYCFYRRNEMGKAIVLLGNRSNGKSTYLDMLKTVLGDDNISALELKEMCERYINAELFGKLANIGDDIDDEFIQNTGVFKKLVTGDELTIQRKYENPFKFHSYAKLFFSTNSMPRIGKGRDSSAIIRRLQIVTFDAVFDKNSQDFDPYIKYKLRNKESIEYLIKLGICGLKRLLENNEFTQNDKSSEALNEYSVSNNPILGFFEEITREGIENEPTQLIYKKYLEYCIRDNLQPFSKIEFSRQVKKQFNLETEVKKINCKPTRIYIQTDSTGEAKAIYTERKGDDQTNLC